MHGKRVEKVKKDEKAEGVRGGRGRKGRRSTEWKGCNCLAQCLSPFTFFTPSAFSPALSVLEHLLTDSEHLCKTKTASTVRMSRGTILVTFINTSSCGDTSLRYFLL